MSLSAETIQHYALNPIHNEKIAPITLSYREENRICGDDIEVHLYIKNNTLRNWWFTGQTSMITTACSCMFGELCIGQELSEILSWDAAYIKKETEIDVSYRRRRAQVIALLATQNAILTFLNQSERRDFGDVLDD